MPTYTEIEVYKEFHWYQKKYIENDNNFYQYFTKSHALEAKTANGLNHGQCRLNCSAIILNTMAAMLSH